MVIQGAKIRYANKDEPMFKDNNASCYCSTPDDTPNDESDYGSSICLDEVEDTTVV